MHWRSIALALGLLVAACSAGPVAGNDTKTKDVNYRLPKQIIPENYKVTLTPYLDDIAGTDKKAATFDGKVDITFTVEDDATSSITLHKHASLTILSTKLQLIEWENDTEVMTTIKVVGDPVEDAVREFYTLQVEDNLDSTETYKLTFLFTGKLQDDMEGFYLSKYMDGDAEQKIATTQFESTNARRAFPCFDEPSMKATFDITIIHHKDYNCLSNMSPKEDTEGAVATPKGYVISEFEQTPIMSTYLVAFTVSKFEPVEKSSSIFNVWARPKAKYQAVYGNIIGKKTLLKLEEYTGFPYNNMTPGMKMDLAAIPDFSAGAMENWGLLTFRETDVLYDEEESTLSAKQRVTTVITHEQAHMWFGDLVTLHWWSDVWLNEGFAAYFEYHATAMVETSWQLPEQFVVDTLQSIFQDDALDSSKPLTNLEVASPSSILSHFSLISYNKGACVIRMMEHMIGSSVFKSAIQSYLEHYQFKNVVPENLFGAIQDKVSAADHLDIATIMQSWTLFPGYPVIQVKLGKEKIEVTQERFLLKSSDKDQSHKWYIPLSYTSRSAANGFASTKPAVIFNATEENVKVDLPAGDDWIIFNLLETGFYRVHYDDVLLRRLVDALKKKDHSGIPALNRAQIVDDVMNLARSDKKYIQYNTAFEVLDYLENEVSYYPWSSALTGLNFIRHRLTQPDHVEAFNRHVLQLLNNIYTALEDVEELEHVDVFNRANILGWACSLGHEGCIAKLNKLFKTWREDNAKKVPINIRSVVYCTAVRHGTKEDWDALWNKFITSNVGAEQVLILRALGCSKDETILKTYLEKTLNGSEIRNQDASTVFFAVASGNQENFKIAFEFMLTRFEDIKKHYTAMGDLEEVLTGIAAKLQSKEDIEKMENFINTADLGDGKEAAESAMALGRANLKWSADNAQEIANYLQKKKNRGQMTSASVTLCGLLAVSIWIWQRVWNV